MTRKKNYFAPNEQQIDIYADDVSRSILDEKEYKEMGSELSRELAHLVKILIVIRTKNESGLDKSVTQQ